MHQNVLVRGREIEMGHIARLPAPVLPYRATSTIRTTIRDTKYPTSANGGLVQVEVFEIRPQASGIQLRWIDVCLSRGLSLRVKS